MRIWALASCGGLLALAACSAEQANTPDLSAAPPDGDDAAQVTARLRATASSPTARPDVRSGQSLSNRARLSPSLPRPATTASQPSSSSQLRERVQRLRAQHGSRLAPSTPLTTTPAPQVTNTPLYTSLQAPTTQAAQPLPRASGVSGENSTPENFPDNFTGRLENAPRSVSESQSSTALPTAPTAPPALSAPLNDTNPLGPVATANVARSYPIAPLRHQGHSDRSQGQSVVLTAPAAPEFTVARVHGGTSAPAIAPLEVATDLAKPTEVTATPAASPIAATNAAATLSAEASPSPEASAAHQSSGTALTLARQSNGETPGGGAGVHQSGGTEATLAAASPATAQSRATSRLAPAAIADRPARPVALPESLPLSPAAPRLSSPSLETNSVQGDQEVSATRPEAAPTHVQAAPATLRLAIPGENPKNLIATYCLTTGGVPLPLGGEAQGSTAPLPKFSPSNQAESSLDLGANPDKAELTTTLCQEASSPAPAHESILEPALIAN
ncbi:MAG: hypothetical protein ACFCVB_18705 [Nodosilinea sp.]